MIRSAQALYDKSLMLKFKSNPNALYGYMRDKSKVKSAVSQLEKADGSLTTNNEEAVEVLNSFFKSVFTNEDPSTVPCFYTRVGSVLSDICITEAEVYDKLSALNPNKAPGPDHLHPLLLKNCASSLARPLFLLFVQSLGSGQLPQEWKQANVTPIFKKGSRTKANNYRPVSLTSQVVKILESIIRSRILQYLSDNNVINHYQHGFVSKKSCFTNLLETFEDWTLAIDEGFGIDVIYLDYSKAFDSVPHFRLIEKLRGYGLSGILLSWLADFLWRRYQRVVLNGVNSEWSEVTSGVPQGSVLGPLLFVLYINDIAEIIKCQLGIFADDTKIYSVIKSLCDVVNLREDLDRMQDWSRLWLLNLNSEKCKVMHIGRSLCSGYRMANLVTPGEYVDLTEVISEKDLGVWTTSNLASSVHCQKAAANATKILGQIKRSFSRISKDLFIFLYKTYVRPHLEYCVQIWCPYLARDVDVLERVQMRATKLVREFAELPYKSRLQKLGIHSLYCPSPTWRPN